MSIATDILIGLIDTVFENLKLQCKIETKTVPGMKRARKRKDWSRDEIASVAGLNNICTSDFVENQKSQICNAYILFCKHEAGRM